MKRTFSVVLLAIGIAAWACNEEQEILVDDLIGTWEVTAAHRDGRETETLNGAIFEFRNDGSMMTNISGENDEGAFTYENMGIHHMGSMEAEYKIDEYAVDSMLLKVTLYQMMFALRLHRKESE